MRILLDQQKCQAHNRCSVYLPEVFSDSDEQGFPIPANDGWFAPESLERAQLAVENCPERALSIQ